jgi:5-formyltetrahydrofolate cyclo-ligase
MTIEGINLDAKKNLRSEARARRAALTDPGFARHIASFADELGIPKGTIVAGYHPFRDEADPRGLMTALSKIGHDLALPCVVSARSALAFRAWSAGDPLHPNVYGIAEPLASSAEVVPGVVLVPLLAFDASGHRLGYGGGYYDRTFETLPRMLLIGIAYSGQELSAIPREAHDHRLDLIVTENGVRRFHHT